MNEISRQQWGVKLVGVLIVGVVGACNLTSEESSRQQSFMTGEQVYQNYCANCHGPNGQKSLSGAADLTKSTLSIQTIKEVVVKGEGVMPPFKNILQKSEVQSVSQYVKKLRE